MTNTTTSARTRYVSQCIVDGAFSVEKIRATFSTAGTDINADAKGRVTVKPLADVWIGRAQTLIADMRRAGFEVRWISKKNFHFAAW